MKNEHERRAEAEAAMGDESQWDWDNAIRVPGRRLSAMMSVRLSPDEFEVISKAAREHGTSISSLLRKAALAVAQSDHTTCNGACPLHGNVTVSVVRSAS